MYEASGNIYHINNNQLFAQVNSDHSLLPNVTLNLRWNDTRGDTVIATRAITEMICDGVATFFGPEGPCHVEAIVSQSRNIPMISYVSTNGDHFARFFYPLFIRSFQDAR